MSRLVGCLSGAAVVALACCAVASAEAPEFGRCVKQVAVEKTYHGKYRDPKCTKSVTAEEEAKKGRYEWEPGPGANNKFTTTGGAMKIETERGHKMSCASEQSSGEFVSGTNNKELATTILFRGCKIMHQCTTSGLKEGEVESNPLVGEVNWENKAKRRTALALRAAPGYEGVLLQVKCDIGVKVDWRGGVLASIKNDRIVEAETLKYTATKRNVQKPHVRHVGEGSEEAISLEARFENLFFEQSGMMLEMTMSGEEPLELNAVL